MSAVSAIQGAVKGMAGKADATMVVLGSDKQVDEKTRAAAARDIMDQAGVDAVLAQCSGEMEGIEQRGKGVIVHNPGFAMNPFLKGDAMSSAIVVKLHVSKAGVEWVEAQPIEVRSNQSKIGMGRKNTHGVIERLIALSKKLKTDIKNEHGRGIWDRD
jgi:hypothetical protein